MEHAAARNKLLSTAMMLVDIPDEDEDAEGSAPPKYGPNTSSPLPVGVVALNDAAAHVPPGWRDLLTQTHYKVLAATVQCPERRRAADAVRVIITDEQLDFQFGVQPDPVLRGILRKANSRSRAICGQCSRRGRLREIGDSYIGTLCTRCAAIPLLREEIWSVLGQREHLLLLGQSVVLNQVPSHLWPSFRRWADLPAEGNTGLRWVKMSVHRYAQWTQHLEALNHWLPSDDDE